MDFKLRYLQTTRNYLKVSQKSVKIPKSVRHRVNNVGSKQKKRNLLQQSERLRFQQDCESGASGGTKYHGKTQNKNARDKQAHTEEI